MTTTKPPVLTDEDIDALRIKAFQTNSADDRKAYFEATSRYFQDRHYRAMDREQAVLERAGADAVRDATLVRLMPEVLASLKYHGQDVSLVADIERALKGTPAAAVAQPARISDDDRMTLAGTLGLLRGHRYTGGADALQRVLDADAALPAVVADDEAKALDLLATLFDAYENGPTCYEDPDDCAGYLGNAVRLGNEDFQACAELLNRRRPRQDPIDAAPQAGQLSGNAGEVDTARLDFLDRMNATLNAHYGTNYRWKLVLSHNITRLMVGKHWGGYVGDVDLNDANHDGLSSCREAIDAAIAASKGAKP